MFSVTYINSSGFSTFLRGVWQSRESEGGERELLVTATGHDGDNVFVGQYVSQDEIDELVAAGEERYNWLERELRLAHAA